MTDFRRITVTGADALAELERLQAEHPATGLWPVLLGSLEDLDEVLFDQTFDSTTNSITRVEKPVGPDRIAAILAEAATIDPAGWFREREEEHRQQMEEFASEDDEFVNEAMTATVKWPDEPEQEIGIITHRDVLTKRPFAEVVIGLFPVAKPWEVLAHLNFGDWNDCPRPAVQCAVHRFWAEGYGSRVVSVTHDIVQCLVASPPADRAAARDLARQQYLYCGDIVDQGCETVDRLAVGLWGAPTWYFWWD